MKVKVMFAKKQAYAWWVVGLKKDGSVFSDEVVGRDIDTKQSALNYVQKKNPGITKMKVFGCYEESDGYNGPKDAIEYAKKLSK